MPHVRSARRFALALALVSLSPLNLRAQPPEAVQHYRTGYTKLQAKDYRNAVIELEAAVGIDSTYGSHPDHIATGEATMCAVYPDARNPFAFTGRPCAELEDWAVDEVWITFGDGGDAAVDITGNLDRKIKALMCHRSQHRDPAGMEERVRTWWQSIAEQHGLPEGASAESFRVVDTR